MNKIERAHFVAIFFCFKLYRYCHNISMQANCVPSPVVVYGLEVEPVPVYHFLLSSTILNERIAVVQTR